MSNLFVFGMGYSASRIAEVLRDGGMAVTGTHRRVDTDAGRPFRLLPFDGGGANPAISEALGQTCHLLVSIGPGSDGDPALNWHGRDIEVAAKSGKLKWIGYLSTVGVYGDHQGAWVDETTQCRPVSDRSKWRLAAGAAWRNLGERCKIPVAVFRLAGIYGPGRSAFDKLHAGTAKRIVKPGQVFNRIHVDDIASSVAAAAQLTADGVYNITDNEPAPPQDVIAHAADLMGIAPPAETAFDDADMTPMARSFYGENKRVSNAKAKAELGWEPAYPTYREAHAAMWRNLSPN